MRTLDPTIIYKLKHWDAIKLYTALQEIAELDCDGCKFIDACEGIVCLGCATGIARKAIAEVDNG